MEIKKVKLICLLVLGGGCITSCMEKENHTKRLENRPSSIIGTWKLITGTTIKGVDTLVTDYTKDQEMIKIINKTHFAFLRHDLKNGKGDKPVFVAGGGKYTLDGNKYIEHLEYFNIREWEGNSFELEYRIIGDTLITKGIEKVEELNVDYINIEKFLKLKD